MKKILLTLALILAFCGTSQAMSVTLGWDANTEVDLAGYNIYWGTAPGVTKSSGTKVNIPLTAEGFTPATPQYTVTNLPNDKKVYFVVTAYDNETPSLESAESNEVVTWIGQGTPPSNPVLRLIRWILGLLGLSVVGVS